MIQINEETFADEVQANAWVSTLLEMKFGYPYKILRNLTFDRKKELYKSAKRKWKKAHKKELI